MARKTIEAFLAALALAGVWWSQAQAAEAIALRAVRPDEQGERLIGLFQGARAAHPAAALAAWKHATGGRGSLGKPLEAAIAALNPAMLREWKNLDDAELRIGFGSGAAPVRWRVIVPNDDGSFAAMTTALSLTDGAREEPLGDVSVVRLGPPGSALAATPPGRLALASTRDGLRLALDGPLEPIGPDDGRPGWHARLDPSGLRDLGTVPGRRLAEALDAVGCREVRGWLALDAEALRLRVSTALEPRPRGKAALDPTWLDVVPASGTLAAVSVALDGSPATLDSAFGVLDRVERADPARAGVAPIRTRLNLLATVARVRPEVDLWPQLQGVTAAILVDSDGQVSGAVIALQAVDASAAGRIADEVLPRLASAYLRAGKPVAVGPDGVRLLGTFEGKPLSAEKRGASVLIGWGVGALDTAREASERPERSAGAVLRAAWGASPPQRAGGFWPGRHRRLAAPGSPIAESLAGASPVVWEGRTDNESARDVVRWPGLRDIVRRSLDALPLDPPPDRGIERNP